MKKLFPVLLLAMIIGLFSSCIIVTNDTSSTHRIKCYNDTIKPITDWCVKHVDSNGTDYTYANSEENCTIASGASDEIRDLKTGYYSICITFVQTTALHPDDYEQTNEIYLNKDVTFDVAERKFYARSAVADKQDNAETQYIIRLSTGEEYPLYK